jgi:hypothetical protein
MPLYRFGLNEENLPADQQAEWHPDDVAAMERAARATADAVRCRGGRVAIPMVLAFRVKSQPAV